MHARFEEVGPIDAEPLRLLAVEDDPADSAWLVQLLETSTVCPYHLSFVLTMADAQMSLEVGQVDCVLLDLSLPDSWGLESVRRILGTAPSIPVVVITGANDQEQGLSAIELGAHDYLEKGKTSGDGILRAARWATARAKALSERSESAPQGLDQLSVPWVRLDPTLAVTSVSPAFLELVERLETEVVGVPLATFVAVADMATVLDMLHQVGSGARAGGVVSASLSAGGGGERPRALAVSPAEGGLAVLALDPT